MNEILANTTVEKETVQNKSGKNFKKIKIIINILIFDIKKYLLYDLNAINKC